MADSTHSPLPPGYRFYPTEEELITFYLHNKLHGNRDDHLRRAIPLIPIYEFDPWQLPQVSGEMCKGESEQWFFFTPRQEREARGGRPNRTTSSGYWKATGSPGYVYGNNNRVIGVKKTMVFYKGKAPSGRKTKWKMNEYKAIDHEQVAHVVGASSSSSSSSLSNIASSSSSTPRLRHEFSLCRIYVKSGCLRAFDRRPMSEATITNSTGHIQATTVHHIDGAANSSGPAALTPAPASASAPPSMVTLQDQNMHMSSPECPSSSGDDIDVPHSDHRFPPHPSVLGEEAARQDWEMEIDDYRPPFWEWEQLNYWDM